MNECKDCDYYIDGACLCSSLDKWYACPIESSKPENQQALREYAQQRQMEMTNEEAIDVLKNDIEICTIQQEQACKLAIKALEQTRWIPVSERLPQTDGVYIVTRRLFNKQVDTEPYYMVDACYFDGSNTWHNDNRINHLRPFLEDIIAWMPLPQPYEVENKMRSMTCKEMNEWANTFMDGFMEGLINGLNGGESE